MPCVESGRVRGRPGGETLKRGDTVREWLDVRRESAACRCWARRCEYYATEYSYLLYSQASAFVIASLDE